MTARFRRDEDLAPARKADHWCAFVGCGKPGSMSHGLQGAGPWYCAKHFWGGEKGVKPTVTLAAQVARERFGTQDDDDWGAL